MNTLGMQGQGPRCIAAMHRPTAYTRPSSYHCFSSLPSGDRGPHIRKRPSCQSVQQHRQVRAHAEESMSERTEELQDDSNNEDVAVPTALTGNSKFAAALQAAMKRSGDASVLTSGEPAPKRAHEPPRPTALEEVLLTALRDSRRNLIMLEEGMKELEAAVGREQMQFERLQFAYKKATRDAAYARTMEMLLERERAKHAVPN